MCQHMEDLHDLVNRYFLKALCYKSFMGEGVGPGRAGTRERTGPGVAGRAALRQWEPTLSSPAWGEPSSGRVRAGGGGVKSGLSGRKRAWAKVRPRSGN